MTEPMVGDILEYGDVRYVVAAVTQERDDRYLGDHCYDHYMVRKVWVWGAEPEPVIQSGGGVIMVMPVQEWITTRWKERTFDGPVSRWPPEDCKVIRPQPGLPVSKEDPDFYLEPDEPKS